MAQSPPPGRKPAAEDPEPSMDDILASIRRILDEDGVTKPASDDVLMLDPSMMVEDGKPAEADPAAAVSEPPPDVPPLAAPPATANPATANPGTAAPSTAGSSAAPAAPENQTPMTPPIDDSTPSRTSPAPQSGTGSLVAPEAAAAAASSVGNLMRTLAAERSAQVGRGSGVTLEDLVREEMRPLLKAWLDTHLPPIVERAVRAEIERVVGRQVG